MDKRRFLSWAGASALVGAIAACTTTGPGERSDPVEHRRSINAKVDEALGDLTRRVPGARQLLASAKGVLVFPSVISAGFVVGGSYGEGALRRGARSVGYYSTAAGSVGLLAGAQSKELFLLFMTQDALDRFEASQGWTVGVDASVAVVNLGADANIDTNSIKAPVISFVMVDKGLMANLSLDGAKFTRLAL